ncbi:sulfate adenylyltransferase [Helicobacter cholecystus]|uniref:Sulfate adenylyltransferase n=1 Tax=Helicobacter cholecystus TaxID=45498 RepID=A0A3D8IU51_9HELI|nr:sulfate adenylyltransferase [Helicobacter cholecystus]RDU68819.1 sulfate adenylyltransferase [Helicobacter cholecystus]VEJ23903.1 sulfate adenylyltransferase [Helicobacter cholecystus]
MNEKKKQIHIDQEAFSILEMVKEGILTPVNGLMNQEQIQEVNKTGLFNGCSFPSPLILSPNGRRNQEVMKSLQIGEEVDLYVQKTKVGEMLVKEVFPINKDERIKKIMGGDMGHTDTARIYQRLGNFGIYGDYTIKSQKINSIKKLIEEKIKALKAKKICGVMLNANPIHMVHEKILQETLMHNDMLIIFLPHHNSWLLPYPLRLKSVQYVVENFLPSHKILIVPLDYTYLLAGQNRMILNALICKNYGCTEFVASLGSSDLSTFYEGNQICTIMDQIQGINLDIKLLSEYIYCDTCNTIKNTKICPHGPHHHIAYSSKNFFELLKMGIMPPEVFIRKEVSAMILAYLFPNQLKKLNKLYQDLMIQNGLIQEEDEKFYERLSELCHVK